MDLKEIIKSLYITMGDISKEDDVLMFFSSKICEYLNSDILILDTYGNVLYEINNNFSSFALKNEISNEKIIETQISKQLENIEKIKINITLDNLYTTRFDRDALKNMYGLFLPIYMYKEKLANIIIYRKDDCFDSDISTLCEYISSLFGLLIWNYKIIETNEKQTKHQNIRTCISTLSYSELEAALSIFEEIENGEGLVVASKIADKAGITRSVIVNALRKFESARIIETRSLGMKGTYIKVLNEYLLKELDKFKK
ncbi:GTP-sensing pleiotropic transcriptional regulator CodY [uncultured Tyzzerella sp.]|uniref:GTP-sensing pleiotropic transcriptional regulator CodY n=1 Tax=uncultured Tyzzerella sp. TaxID=2321398 RepID=UPI0029425641|nr:GTP-sensing pleiotropic transcriptional regulator CodY [uncultured Tyzzerella sp.]